MAKKRSFTPIGAIEQGLQQQTKQLYEQTPTAIPAAPNPGDGVGESAEVRTTKVVPEKKKKPQSIIPRANAKCIYFEDEHNEAVERIHWLCKSDRQDIIRTALDHFLSLYYKDGELSEEGRALIDKYYDKTHIMV